ncbi:MAG: tetratricopeptide repeat protein [Methanobacteriota archaeon]
MFSGIEGGSETGERRETELALLFERLFSAYLGEALKAQPVAMFSNKLRLLSKTRPGVSALTLGKEGSVTIDSSTMLPDEMIKDMSAAFDAIVDVTAFSKGQKTAYEDAGRISRAVLKQFSNSKYCDPVKASLLRGYLGDTAPLGVNGEELALPDGVPRNSMLLLESPSGAEREMILRSMIRNELECGGAVVAVLGTRTPSDLRKALAESGMKAGSHESKGMLRFVDWFSYRERAVNGVETDKSGAFLASGDLTNLALAMERALGQIEFAPRTRIISDVVSPAINSHGAAKTHDFIQSVSGKMKTGGAIVVWAFDPKGLDTKTISSLHNLADAVLTIRKGASTETVGSTLEVASLRGARFNKGVFQLVQTKRGITIATEAIDEGAAIEELRSLPGVDERLARALFDAGYHTVEKLEKVDTAALKGIVGADAAARLYDYMHSIEYAKRMLFERSRKWVAKAKNSSAEGNIGAALDNLRRAIEISEENAEAWYDLGHLLYDQGKGDEARDCYLKSARLDKEYEGEWYGEDKAEFDSLFTCSTCGEAIESEVTRCPGCGVVLTVDERRRLAESLSGQR